MEEHRGKILEIAIREKGFTFAAAAKHMSISRRTLYNYFEDPELSWQKIIDFDQILGLGLHNKFTDLRKYIAPTPAPSIVEDAESSNYWKNKYIDLLEKYTKLLEKTP